MFYQPGSHGQPHGFNIDAYALIGDAQQHAIAAVRQAKVQIGVIQIQHGLAMLQAFDRNSVWRAAQQGSQKMAQGTVSQQAQVLVGLALAAGDGGSQAAGNLVL